jgi:hypothetical protein
MKRPVMVLIAAGLVIATGSVFGLTASSGAGSSPPKSARQTVEWKLTPDHSSSQHWRYIDLPRQVDALEGFDVRSTGLLTMTVSANLTGAPVQIRWLDGGKVESPASVAFAPSGDSTAFSYTFADTGKKEACGHLLRLEWRSPTGKKVALPQGDVVVTYLPAAHDSGVCA